MPKQITEGEVIALATALAGEGGGGGGTGDGDMKMSVYDSTEEVKDAGGIKNYVADEISGALSSLGDLASKDSVEATYTPAGSVSVSKGEDTKATVNSITDVGTLPSITVSGEDMTIDVGTLPTKGDGVSVVTASGTVSASFSGTQATIESQ